MPKYEEGFFKSVLDSMHDLVLVKGQRSRLVWANRAFLEYYGMTEEELFNTVDGPQSDPDDTLQYVRDDQKVFDTKVPLDIPSESVTDKSGQARNFHTIKFPVFENNNVVRTVGVSRLKDDELLQKSDMSHAEAKLFSAPLRTIVARFPIPVALLDLRGRVVNCSPLWNESFGEVDLSKTDNFFSDLYPRLNQMNALIDKACKGIEPETIDISLGEGPTLRHYKFSLSQWAYPNGESGGVTITATDITKIIDTNRQLDNALKRVEAAEQKSKEAWINVRALMDYSRNFIGLMSNDGILLDANQTALKAAGIDAETVLGKPFWEAPWWTHSEKMQDRLKAAIQAVANGSKDGFEALHLAPDGTPIYVDFSLSPIFDEKSHVIGMVPEGINVTEQKVREAKIGEYSRDLQRANDDLKRINTDLDDFTHAASHDLKSPLRVISNLAGWLVEDHLDRLPEDAQKDLLKIKARSGKMEEMLDALLHYSRVGRTEDDLEDVDLEALVREIFDLLDKPEDFQLKVAGELPVILARRAPLHAVLRNLISNAIKHRRRDSDTVEISCIIDQGFYKVSVNDNGTGIPEGQGSKVFRIFRTLSGKEEDASGVGLAIVKKVVTGEGGEISFTNNSPKPGVTFVFSWPILVRKQGQ